MRLRLLAATATCVATLLASAAPALAHVTTDPDAAPKGGELTLRFRVPNEVTNTNVVKVDIAFPTDHPLLGVAVEPIAGWTSTAPAACPVRWPTTRSQIALGSVVSTSRSASART